MTGSGVGDQRESHLATFLRCEAEEGNADFTTAPSGPWLRRVALAWSKAKQRATTLQLSLSS